MAIHYRTEGFILKKNDLREADQVFTVFTKDFGKIRILARAIRRIKSKLRSGADLFYLSELEFIQGKAYKTLTDATALNKFKDIRTCSLRSQNLDSLKNSSYNLEFKKDLDRLKTVQQIADSLDSLVHKEEKDKQIWDLLNEVLGKYWDKSDLSQLGINQIYPNLIYHYFLWNLFSLLGYQVDLYHCVACQKKLSPSRLYFSPDQGGILCSDCSDRAEQKIEISPNVIKILRILLKKDWDTLSKLKIQDPEKEQLEAVSELNLRSLASLAG